MDFRAVIFDIGGVVVSSPLHAIARFEQAQGIPDGFVNRLVVSSGPTGAWSRLERGELAMQEFYLAFDEECAQAGHALSGEAMMNAIAESSRPRPQMLEAIRTIRKRGLRAGALTNNWLADEPRDVPRAQDLRPLFDAFVESSVVGLRKPDPRIYQHVCRELQVTPPESVFLDDIGSNLKAARELGMHTIKVSEPERALDELAGVLGFTLSEA